MKKKFNWDYVIHQLKEHGYSLSSYGEKRLGKSVSYLSYYKNHPEKELPVGMIIKMREDLELDEDTLFYRVDEMKNKEETTTFMPEESDFEVKVKAALEEINTKLDMLLEVEERLNKLVAYLPEKTPQDKAKELLEKMINTSGKCDYDDYVRRCGLVMVTREVAEDVAKKSGLKAEVTGYGAGKKRWLVKPSTRTVQKEGANVG